MAGAGRRERERLGRLAPPPLTDRDVAVDAATRTAFATRGFVVLRGLASREEAAAWRRVIEPAARALRWDERALEERDAYGRAFDQALNLWRRVPGVGGFTLARRFARVAARLLGVDAVRLYHDQALVKPAGGGPTPWHQDQTYWPLTGPGTVTLWMPLVDVPDPPGGMRFVPGSHRRGPFGIRGIGDASEAAFRARIEREGWPVARVGALRAGDATFHHGWTVHGADANPHGPDRPAMTVIYMADGTRVTEADDDAQALDLKLWLGGRRAGEAAAGPLNPLLYSRSEAG